MDRKKELKALYKQMKPKMGIIIIKRNDEAKCYIEETQDLQSKLNSTKRRLERLCHPNKELQREWKSFGASKFTIEILDNLEYDKDESKTDYTEDLKLLKEIWKDKLAEENMGFYGE